MKNAAFRFTFAPVLAALLMLPAGCGGGTKSKVSGVITYKNAPVPGGMIFFSSESGGGFSSPIQMDGTYSITDIPPGTYSVVIETDSVNPDKKAPDAKGSNTGTASKTEQMSKQYAEKMGKGGGAADAGAGGGGGFGAAPVEELRKRYMKIPPKYVSKLTSGLTIEVGTGTVTKDFPLTD